MSLIFTNHAKERMSKRKIAVSEVEQVLNHPNKTYPGKKEGTVKFIKQIGDRRYHVVAKLLEDRKNWLVLSVWVRGEEDSNWVEWLVRLPLKMAGFLIVKIYKFMKRTATSLGIY